jgi:hypothetical protein
MQTLNVNPTTPAHSSPSTTLTLDRVSRWTVHSRLQSLDIDADCGCDRPLTLNLHTAAEAIQVWCVIRACTAPRADLAEHLNRCWQQRSHQ